MKIRLVNSAGKFIGFFIYFLLVIEVCEAISFQFNSTLINSNKLSYVVTEDSILTVPELIQKYGYPFEMHDNVITEDGYVLTLHRIPYGKKSGPAKNKPIVFIQSGFFSNSAEAILSGPDNAIGYILADEGYDVWLGNTRGSRYCTKHMSTHRTTRKYWDYSWSDIGYYDIPAMIDYILKYTNQQKLFYIGHSRGTTAFFVMCSTRPEYNNKIRAMVAMAPVAYMGHMPNPLFQLLAYNLQLLKTFLESLNFYYYPMNSNLVHNICYKTQFLTIINPDLCTTVLFSLGGFDFYNYNTSTTSTLFGHLPDSFSIKEFEHYGQSIVSGKFRDFNYGPTINLEKYNSIDPPEYDVTKVTAPVILFYSANDLESSAIDVERLISELGNPVAKFNLLEGPNHFSYFHGKNSKSVIYDKIIELFKEF